MQHVSACAEQSGQGMALPHVCLDSLLLTHLQREDLKDRHE